MAEAIREASKQLRVAGEQHLPVCLHNFSLQEKPYHDLPRGFIQQIDGEMECFSNYEASSQKKGRCASRVVPIHSLPSEILLRIFYVLLAEPCIFGRLNHKEHFPRNGNLDFITQVCSRWRSIARSSPILWTHVDIPLIQTSIPRLIPRLTSSLQLACNIPLEIHIHDTGADDSKRGYDALIRFLETVAGRVGSLELALNRDHYMPIHISILETILSTCSPQIFRRLIIRSDSEDPPYILPRVEDIEEDTGGSSNEGSDVQDAERCLDLGLTEAQIEYAFSGLTALDLTGCFPDWPSSAYHGLVDLRLTISSNYEAKVPTIHMSELINILTASPGLRVFHFRLWVVDQATSDTETVPVHLKDLEVVNLSTNFPTYDIELFILADILRLLDPGSKPLRLTLNAGEGIRELLASSDELNNFFARSNVERLCLEQVEHFSERILIHAPDVRVLVLQWCYFGNFGSNVPPTFGPNNSNGSDDSNNFDYDTSLVLPCLDSCYVLGGAMMVHTLRNLAKLCPAGLVMDRCEVYTGIDKVIADSEIPNFFPTVKCVSIPRWSNLTADWDVLD